MGFYLNPACFEPKHIEKRAHGRIGLGDFGVGHILSSSMP